MKKILLFAVITLLGISAYAQSSSEDTKVKNQEKEQSDVDREDSEIKLTKEEKSARKLERRATRDAEKADRKASKEIRKADRKADMEDDGINNESNIKPDSHGSIVNATARETTLEGREKGEAVSSVANSKARKSEKLKAEPKAKASGKNTKAAKPKKAKK
jgi:hypothetical protein